VEWDPTADEGAEEQRPLLPAADRVWRHPSELGAGGGAENPHRPHSLSSTANSLFVRVGWPVLVAAGLFGACMTVGFLAVAGMINSSEAGSSRRTTVLAASSTMVLASAESWLGVEGGDLSENIGANATASVEQGALVYTVTPNSPAESAGVKEGDIVLEVNGEPANTMTLLTKALHSHRPGDTITLTVMRKGVRTKAIATLGARPAAR
jgi:membrane-associated protease RseP (regulator of RpoE activity)